MSASGEMSPPALIDLLASMPDRLEGAVAALGAREAEPSVDGWSARELSGHLGDAARMWGARMRRVALEDRPLLEPYDQDAFVSLGAYRLYPAADLARVFRAVSEPTVAFLRGLSPDAWKREGVHAETGPLTLLDVVRVEAEHEREHIEQIEALGAGSRP